MANMAYCRWINTLEDLRDCFEHLEDEDLSSPENAARARLLRLCRQIVAEAEDCGLIAREEDC